tara:strand:+ start:611 stop:898 length:288 start_codon:yes stop_codon:yes gene_type:complete
MLKDMLKEKGKWSQGRVYLLVSVIVYYITLSVLMVAGLHKSNEGEGLDMDKFEIIIEALKYAMMLFGGYVFGGKFMDVIKVIGGKKEYPPKKEIL